MLRYANIDASVGALEKAERTVDQITARWPAIEIVLRAYAALVFTPVSLRWPGMRTTPSTKSSTWHVNRLAIDGITEPDRRPHRLTCLAKRKGLACLPTNAGATTNST